MCYRYLVDGYTMDVGVSQGPGRGHSCTWELASREPKGTTDLCIWGGDLRSIDAYICT